MEYVAKIVPEMQGRVHGMCCENGARNAGMRTWNVLRKSFQKFGDACMEYVAKIEPEMQGCVHGMCCENRARNAGMRAWNVLRKSSQKRDEVFLGVIFYFF
jgi:uncharacterized protein (UPF0264 family)